MPCFFSFHKKLKKKHISHQNSFLQIPSFKKNQTFVQLSDLFIQVKMNTQFFHFQIIGNIVIFIL